MEQESKPIPRRLADFEIIRRLGVGGMAEVFLAKKRGAEGTFKLLVVKRVLPAHGASRRFRTMFAEEAQLATRLNHPNIVQVYEFQDYGEDGQLLTMEYVEGPDLRRLARAAQAQGQRLPPYVAAYAISEVAKGLHYAHERKDERGSPLDIVHRDVSPQNVLLSFDGAVKIADFGIASANMFRDEPGVLKGKTAFMSPEQARGEKVDRRTDIYSLGVVFYELLTGRPVHGSLEGQELLLAVRAGRVEPPSTFAREVPAELEAIVARALSLEPSERFATARDMGAAITRALFQKQQLVDSHVLETVIGQFVGREQPFEEDPREEAPREPGQQGSSLMVPRTATVSPAETGSADATGGNSRSARQRERSGREVRHVAVVVVKLHGIEQLTEKIGVAAAEHALGQLKATVNEIAFKRNALLSWEPGEPESSQGTAGRAVVGLLANPTRAPSDAVWFAVDVHEAIQGACADMPVRLAASIGIARGIASGRRDAAGNLVQHELEEPATYLAELLGRRAPEDVSWVAGGLYRLVRRDFLWGDAPTIRPEDAEERGLPRHMRIYALLRPLTREERLQEMSLAPNDLVGRDAELADLHAAYYTVVGSGPGLGQLAARVVSGELGIGKTALATTFLNELPPDARILRVECSPARSEVPFAAVAEWIRELTGTKPEQSLQEATERVREALGQFAADTEAPEIISRLAELVTGRTASAQDEADHALNRQLVATGLRRFFARAALEAPLVVVLDGLQWCDTPSLKLVAEFLRSGEPLPVLVLLIARPDDHVTPYIDGLVRIELRGLSAENQIRLLQARLGVNQGVAQVCADLLPRAGGNPFFLLEMVDALLERGLLEIREGPEGAQELARAEHADTTFPLPSTLEQLIADRLAELPAQEQVVIDWLAVAGGPLADRDLRALVERDSDESVARLCARGLCDHRGETIDVRHPLTRDVAYLALDKQRREAMHRQLGEHLAETPLAKGLTAAIIARHLARGRVRTRAADFYLEAAAAARGAYQTRLARRYYQRVAALLP
ncbi:MAG TPA: protein kinase, partial [Polyangiaceae bacterium]